VLRTSANSTLGVTFNDATTFNLTANARIVVDNYVYEDGGKQNAAVFDIARGTVAFVAAAVARTGDMKISTPTATLGIRGTTGLVEVPQNASAASANNVSGGLLDIGRRQYTLRFTGRFSPEQLGALVLAWRDGRPVHLADVATIGLLHERNVRRSDTVAEQLQGALNSRVVIEQAKGKLAERLSVDMDQAFTMLRDHARNSNQRLTDVARNFVNSATADFPPPPRQPSA